MIPGGNLLGLALSVIAPQTVLYLAYEGKTTNAAGKEVVTYAEPTGIYGSFQPINRDRYEANGLDFDKSYATFYATGSYKPPFRNGAADRFAYAGRLWEAVGKVDWFAQDGWDAVMLVDVGAYV